MYNPEQFPPAQPQQPFEQAEEFIERPEKPEITPTEPAEVSEGPEIAEKKQPARLLRWPEEETESTGPVTEFLRTLEQNRSPETIERLRQIRERAKPVFQRLTGTELPRTDNILLQSELNEFLAQAEREGSGSKIETSLIGLTPESTDGVIGHELFHCHIEESFLEQPNVEAPLIKLANNVELQHSYERYLRDEGFYVGDSEKRYLDYRTDPREISAHILTDYLNYITALEKGESDSLEFGPTRLCAGHGHLNEVAELLEEYERHIREKTNNPDFALEHKTRFLAGVAEQGTEAGIESVRMKWLDKEKKETVELIESIKPESLADDSKAKERVIEKIAKIMSKQDRLPNELRRQEWVYSFLEDIDSSLSKNPVFRETMGFYQGTHELLGLRYDEDRKKVSWTSGEISSQDEYMEQFRRGIEELRARGGGIPEQKPGELSFEDFVKDEALVHRYSARRYET